MIYVGYTDDDKRELIAQYQSRHDIRKTVVISADKFPLPISGTDQITYSEVITYVVFYRLLQEIDSHTLIVINECLRTSNRYDLTYNCIRNYLNQTDHQLIFQMLPQIDTCEDFMILFDFDTRSRWKRRKYDINLISLNSKVSVNPLPLEFTPVTIPTLEITKETYAREKERRFATLGVKDPHTIPRNLYLLGGKDKRAYIDNLESPIASLFGEDDQDGCLYVARNKRLSRDYIVTYSDIPQRDGSYVIVELPHRFIDFIDFVRRTGQTHHRVMVADLAVDRWYFERYQKWKERIFATYSDLQ